MAHERDIHLAELIAVAGLAAFGLACNAPFTLALAATVSAHWVANLPEHILRHVHCSLG